MLSVLKFTKPARVSPLLIIVYLSVMPCKAQTWCDEKLVWKAVDYKMDIQVDFKNEKLFSHCELTVKNNGEKDIQSLPLLLYRLLKVKSIKDESGAAVRFTQNVVAFDDFEQYQANFIEVSLPKHVAKSGTVKLIIDYEGYLLGYVETGMLYVKDHIDADFTILRSDCVAYPEPGYPCKQVNRAAGFDPTFNYNVSVTVPDSLSVVNGGELIDKTSANGNTKYTYKNLKLAWRMDFTIGKYKMTEVPPLKIYYLSKDSLGVQVVARFARKTLDLYTGWWGPLQNAYALSVIEIPAGWGSQADVTAILQTADAFTDSMQMRQMYHEISHLWNVKITDVYNPRWNEGLASFLESLTVDKLEGRPYLEKATAWYMNSAKKKIGRNEKLKTVPMADFGQEQMTDCSYTMGMLMFNVLYNIVGEDGFNKIIKENYALHKEAGCSTRDFTMEASKLSSYKLEAFFNDWMYTTKYVDYILADMSIKDISKLYIIK